ARGRERTDSIRKQLADRAEDETQKITAILREFRCSRSPLEETPTTIVAPVGVRCQSAEFRARRDTSRPARLRASALKTRPSGGSPNSFRLPKPCLITLPQS